MARLEAHLAKAASPPRYVRTHLHRRNRRAKAIQPVVTARDLVIVRRRRAALKSAAKVDVDLSTALPEPPKTVLRPKYKDKFKTHQDEARRALAKQTKRAELDLPSSDVDPISANIRYLPGGRKRFIELISLAAQNGDPVAMAWRVVYEDLSTAHQSRVNLSDVCIAAGVKPNALLAAVVGHGVEHQMDMARLIGAAFHPQVVEAMAKSAVRTDGPHAEIAAEDRRQFLQGHGTLPVPKGTSTSIHIQQNATANSAAAASASDPSVPKFAEDIAALRDVVDLPALPSGD